MAEKTSLETAAENARDEAENRENDLTGTNGETADNASDETEEIREQIEETRNRLGETIDAIQEKLSFSNISGQMTEQIGEQISNIYETAKETVFDATVKKAVKFMSKLNRDFQRANVINKVGENPLPLLLITIGAGLIFFDGKKKKRSSYNYENQPNPSLGRSGKSDTAVKPSMPGDAKDKLTGAADGTMKKFGDLGSQAKNRYDHYIQETPLVIGAVAFAAGAAIGLAIPATEYENEIAGESRAKLISKVKDSVNETVDKVKDIAGQAKDTIGEEAKNQGLV